jgi:hypothetical protein
MTVMNPISGALPQAMPAAEPNIYAIVSGGGLVGTPDINYDAFKMVTGGGALPGVPGISAPASTVIGGGQAAAGVGALTPCPHHAGMFHDATGAMVSAPAAGTAPAIAAAPVAGGGATDPRVALSQAIASITALLDSITKQLAASAPQPAATPAPAPVAA